MKKFTVQCVFCNMQHSSIDIYIGKDFRSIHHPIYFQRCYLREIGTDIPVDFREWLEKIQQIAELYGCDFEELCVYAIGEKPEKQCTKKVWSNVFPDIKGEEKDKFIAHIARDILVYAPFSKLFSPQSEALLRATISWVYYEEGGASLARVFGCINFEPYYNLCVILDTFGKRLPEKTFDALANFVQEKLEVREKLIFILRESLIQWAAHNTKAYIGKHDIVPLHQDLITYLSKAGLLPASSISVSSCQPVSLHPNNSSQS